MACVQSIIQSAGELAIPVYISDDSTDDTNVEIIRQIISSYPHIIHSQNSENLGIDRNILKSVDICSCQYAWILGEDDRLLPNAVSYVRDVLERKNPPFLYVNYKSIDASMKIVLKERSLPLTQDDTIESSAFLTKDAWSMGFIGSCIVRTEYWHAIKPDRYIGTYFAHVGRIMEYLKGKSLFRIADPLVLNRCGSPGTFSWTNSTFDVVSGWKRLMKELEPIYGKDVCQASLSSFEKAHGLNSLYFLAYLRADSAFNRDMYKFMIQSSGKSIGYKMGSLIIALIPSVIFQCMRYILNQIRAIRYGRI
jgi:glycosyltransferase involved in cell wall biosynthesis